MFKCVTVAMSERVGAIHKVKDAVPLKVVILDLSCKF
jgi:hypothetical protein